MRKICILGHFAFGHNAANGQTIKTKILTSELERLFTPQEVISVDTSGGSKTLIKAPFQAVNALKNSKNVIIFPAHNGLRVYAPLLSLLKRFFRNRKIHYVVIGGWLPEFLKSRRCLLYSLLRFDGIYVETNAMKIALEEQGLSNVYVLPNCKKLSILGKADLVYSNGRPFKLCTFSRVMKEKGIETAVDVVTKINNELGSTVFSLDIYGQIDANQVDWFERLKKSFPEYIKYGGVVPFDLSVETLKSYFALLFPTYYEGEGFAGTLIDAYSAGIPVIASDWRYNSEIVSENTGYIFPTENKEAFIGILKDIAQNPADIDNKKVLCIKEAEKYLPEKAISVLIDNLN